MTLSINGVSVDGDEFQEADYASSGDYGVYTVDTSGSSVTLKIFMPSSDGSSADVEISYTMSGAVMLWQDTAELYWKFVGDGWGEDSNDVTLNVSFDASLVQQNPATVGDTLRAWGHGPLAATVTPDGEDGEVDYDVPRVRAGEFAEARRVPRVLGAQHAAEFSIGRRAPSGYFGRGGAVGRRGECSSRTCTASLLWPGGIDGRCFRGAAGGDGDTETAPQASCPHV